MSVLTQHFALHDERVVASSCPAILLSALARGVATLILRTSKRYSVRSKGVSTVPNCCRFQFSLPGIHDVPFLAGFLCCNNRSYCHMPKVSARWPFQGKTRTFQNHTALRTLGGNFISSAYGLFRFSVVVPNGPHRRRDSEQDGQEEQQTKPKPIGCSGAHSCSSRTIHSN